MKYGIIVCPKCKKGKAVILTNKTTRCHRCNKTYQISKMKIFYKSNSEIKIRHEIGRINAEMHPN
jgi:transposase-like protein